MITPVWAIQKRQPLDTRKLSGNTTFGHGWMAGCAVSRLPTQRDIPDNEFTTS